VNIGVISKQTFLRGMEEVGAVVDAGLFAWGTAEDFGLPGVEMRVEMNDAYGAVFASQA
jgi:hypothetical protein